MDSHNIFNSTNGSSLAYNPLRPLTSTPLRGSVKSTSPTTGSPISVSDPDRLVIKKPNATNAEAELRNRLYTTHGKKPDGPVWGTITPLNIQPKSAHVSDKVYY